MTTQNKVVCCDAGAMKCLAELFQPSFGTEPFFTPLAARLVRLLEGVPTNSWYGRAPPPGMSQSRCPRGLAALGGELPPSRSPSGANPPGWLRVSGSCSALCLCPPTPKKKPRSGYFRETIRRDIRRVREMFRGEQLSRELARIQQRLDSVELLSLDIIVNLLLSYRDVQVGI